MKRTVLVIAMSAVILVTAISVYLRIEQYRFRRQAERLLSDIRELELEKASAEHVKAVVSKWGFEQWRGPNNPCTEDECIYRLELVPKAAQGHISADPFMGALVARPLEWLGLRLAVVHAWAHIRGKALKSVSFSVWTLGQGCDGHGRLECTLMGYADTQQRGSGWSSHQQPDVTLKQYLLHPDYLVGSFPEWLNADTGGSPAVIVWAEFSPNASTADVSRLMQFDLSCLTRLRSCKDRDLMPAVWAQSVEDRRELPKNLTCTPELSKRVAQLADVIAVVRPDTVELSPPPYNGRPPRLRGLEIVKVIRKPEYVERRASLDVDVERQEIVTTADTRSPIRASQEYVFLLQVRSNPDKAWFALYPCGVLSFNDANLAMVREPAANGAD